MASGESKDPDQSEPSMKTGDLVKVAKNRGLPAAAAAFGLAVVLGVADQFGARIVPGLADKIDVWLRPPYVVMTFSEPLELGKDDLNLQRVDQELKPAAPAAFKIIGPKTYQVRLSPGTYRAVILVRAEGSTFTVSDIHKVVARGDEWSVDTARANWETLNETTEAVVTPGSPDAAALSLEGTRYAIIGDDTAAAAGLEREQSRILLTALAEVGVGEKGPPSEQTRVRRYWSAAPEVPPAFYSQLSATPWGGAFLGWVVREAGATPPAGSASFDSWMNWGVAAPSGKPVAGAIAVFEASSPSGALSEIRSRKLAGVVVRVRDNCVDIVAGNVADRVVVTCVKGRLLSVRLPPAPTVTRPPPLEEGPLALYVGDFDRCYRAKSRGLVIGTAVPGQFGMRVLVVPKQSDGNEVFGAYLAGAPSRRAAQAGCDAIKLDGTICRVVPVPSQSQTTEC